MRRKRLADWLEKMSVAFVAGSVLSVKGSLLSLTLGILCFAFSMCLTEKGD